jgi:hypothetical protein
MSDATKAMQQLDGLEIAGGKIAVKIAALAPGDPGVMMNTNLDLDDEGDSPSHVRAYDSCEQFGALLLSMSRCNAAVHMQSRTTRRCGG